MRILRAVSQALGITALSLAATGCFAPRDSFLGKRWMDFADCFDASAGFAGPLPYVRVKVTDYFVLAGGDNQTFFAIGWHGRYTAAGSELEQGQGVPFVRSHEWAGAPPRIETSGPFTTTREYDTSIKPAWGTQLADKYCVGIWIAWGLNARLNLNVVELTDFMAGWFGSDILRDDAVEPPDWPGMMRQPETPTHPVL